MRRTSFEIAKRLDGFEWAFNSQISKAKIIGLVT